MDGCLAGKAVLPAPTDEASGTVRPPAVRSPGRRARGPVVTVPRQLEARVLGDPSERGGRWDVGPGDYCDCLRRMPDKAPRPKADPGLATPMSHCSPFTGEVLLGGKCVCPSGTAYEPHDGYGRCLAPCPSGRPHDCGPQ